MLPYPRPVPWLASAFLVAVCPRSPIGLPALLVCHVPALLVANVRVLLSGKAWVRQPTRLCR